ncbi:hypothetical protein VTN02DRAFT_6233 [Thermoascus thermophilus]
MSPPSHHHPPPSPSQSCPFCAIASAYPPIPPSKASSSTPTPAHAHAHLILSTPHVLAFLDTMPLTRGHVLVVTRRHWEHLGRVGVRVGMELGKWLPVISRVVMRVVLGRGDEGDHDSDAQGQGPAQMKWNWNVVQNNGPLAAQVVPHLHFHIIPRPPLSSSSTGSNTGTGTRTGTGANAGRSWVMFGRGQREELDEEEGEVLARAMREELAREVRRVREVEGVDLECDLAGDGGGGVKL